MQEIGKILKQHRLEQNLSLDEISEKTAFSIAQINALEEGNLDYFKEDISYVRFFVQNYCKVLKVDFNQFKATFDHSMLTYTNMLSQKEIEEIKKSNEEIRYKAQIHTNQNTKKQKRKLDFSVLSLLVLATIMVGSLFFMMSQYVIPSMLSEKPPGSTKPTVIIDDTIVTTSQSTTTTSKAGLSLLTVQPLSASEFELSGFQEGDLIQLGITFNHRTWIDVKLDSVSFQNPASKIYSPKDSVVYEIEAKQGTVITMNLGYYDSNEFFLNGTKWIMPENLANYKGGKVVKLILKGASS